MSPWLSVVMPVHNGAEFLHATLSSAAAERPEGVEFLIYDSAGDDGASRRVAEAFHDRLAIIWHDTPEMKPWTAKTNRGVEEARASHVIMLHQDDIWLPGHLSAVRRMIADSPEASLSIAPSLFIGAKGQVLGKWRLPFAPGLRDQAEVVGGLLVQNSIALPSVVMRRDAFLAVGGMEESLWYTADWDLYLKLAQAGVVAVRRETTTGFRLHGNSLTMTGSRDLAEFRRQQERVLERHAPKASLYSPAADRRARASISVNCALAAASAGDRGHLWRSGIELAKLGPLGLARYLHQSRIADRLWPRVKLAMAGAV